jgi:acetyltransferase-like isoleucine patch superfamily enzyme
MRRRLARFVVDAYRFQLRARSKAFSVLGGGAFASFGPRSVVELPVRLGGEGRIAIGADVYIGSGSWLQAIGGGGDGDGDATVAITVGDGTSVSGGCVLSAVREVTLGRKVLIARNCYIADHSHAFGDATRAVLEQGVDRVAAVKIGDGVWLGENVVVGPGVTIGDGAVIGANAVVLDDVPSRSVAVGAPARVVRQLDAVEPAP